MKTPNFAILAGLITIYLVWGSTYLAIRVAVETLPPFLMAGARFVVAGSILTLLLTAMGRFRATTAQWGRNAIIGLLLLLGGNGLVSWAEQTVPSGVATLIVSLNPLMMVLAEWVLFRRSKGQMGASPGWITFVGLAMGFLGLGILVGPSLGRTDTAGLDPWRVGAILFACITWTIGSMLSRYSSQPADPFTSSAIQMLCGGIWLLIAGGMLGESTMVQWSAFSTRSLWAWAYLVVAGSLVAFTTFAWLMKRASPTLVSTYAYVNPIVAVFLGWLLLDEKLDGQIFLSASTIILGVALITIFRRRQT